MNYTFVTHLAQLVEHGSYEPRVVGSSPTLSKRKLTAITKKLVLIF